ncbi:hypothetical protein [Saccharothrix deserti]|uniref:hypothetical protein n=1 Tax=Saccharothrix deserti TaxID=2593674 RepID=UPI0023684866|nr:hypothetical protein [Saccharothrix deserti]
MLHGIPEQVHITHRSRWGRERSYYTAFEGVIPHVERRFAEADGAENRFAGYLREVPCSACGGARLRPSVLAVTVGGRNVAELTALPIDETLAFLESLEPAGWERRVAEGVLAEIGERLRFLLDVGLDYLSLNRPAASLSGGEAQRIRLATQIGSGLVGVLYVLDEPTTGLHVDDVAKLVVVLNRLADAGNTVVVIEHNLDVIKTADWLIDLGPEGGRHGGTVIAQGTPEHVAACQDSHTGRFLRPLLAPARQGEEGRTGVGT